MFIKLAVRNLARNFRRTLLTFLAIAIGLMFLLVLDSLLAGIDLESFQKIINFETGHIKIYARGYDWRKENFLLDKLLTRPAEVKEKLKPEPEVLGVAERINFRIMLSDGVDQLPAVGLAINPTEDESVFLLKNSVSSGEFLASATEEAMLIGEGLAKDFGVGLGDYLTILTRTRYETYQALDLKIKGILKTEDPKIDWSAVVIPLGLGQKALDLGQAVTEIDIKIKDPSRLEEFRDKLAKELTGVEIVTWKDLAEDVVAIGEAKRGVSTLLFGSIVLIALIGITNTILLAAFERAREIGTMMAMGMKRREILLLFVLEGAIIGVLGSATGCLLGALANLPLVIFGINWGVLMRDLGDIGYRIAGVSYGVWRPGMFLLVFVFGVVVSALVSIYPAWVASRLPPNEALRRI